MRRTRPIALLAAGSITGSHLLRNRAIASAIGPVKSTSLRVASRLVNSLRAGHAVDGFDEFRDCRFILAMAPTESLASLLAELRGADCADKVLVTIGGESPVGGAQTKIRAARVREIPSFDGRWFVADGDHHAALELRRALRRSARLSILPAGSEHAWDAAQELMSRCLLALMAAADDCLRAAALSPADADAFIERALGRTGRAWMRGKRKVWPGAVREAEVDRTAHALSAVDPVLASWFRLTMLRSESWMGAGRRGQLQSRRDSR